MAYNFENKKFNTVGKGESREYEARQIKEGDGNWKHENEAELLSDLLEIAGSFSEVQNITRNAVNQYLRFKDAPGADPLTRIKAFAKKNNLSREQIIAMLQDAE